MYFITIDPSEGTGGDNYAFTIMDPYTLQVVAEFKSPYMTIHGCSDLVQYLVNKFFPKALIIVERNRNGGAVIEVLKRTPLKHMIYSSPEASSDNNRIRDKLDDNGFVKEEFIRNKYFGANTTSSTRTVMMNILMDAVQFAKNIVNTQYIVEDINNLIVKNNKIQAAVGQHDDCVMSWLIGLYVYYYGERLERYGFVKGEVPTDVEEDDVYIQVKKLYSSPGVKEQFPTLWAYYQNEIQKRENVARQQHQAASMEFIEHKLGGLTELSGSTTIEESSVPELDEISIDGINDVHAEQAKRKSLIKRFMSINR